MEIIERFIEIPLVGALLLLPVIPWLYLGSTNTNEVVARILKWSYRRRAALAIAVVFVLGVVGNQLVDVVTEEFEIIDPKEHFVQRYRPQPDSPASIEGAEYVIGTRSEYARTYFDRHRMFMRIQRAAAAGALLLLVSMLVFSLRSKRRIPVAVYFMVFVSAIAFSAAYYTETFSFWRKVSRLEEAGLARPLPERR